jgi:hypothetical protein
VITSLRGIAGFYTDYLWFDSLGLSGVWRGILGAKAALALIFSGLFFGVLWVNLLIAERLAPKLRPAGPEEELVERYHELVAGRTGLVRTAVAAFFALLAGGGVSSQWNEWVLFTNRVDFGESDATFGNDIGFYVFQLPFLIFVASWLFSALVIVLVVTILAHYLNGGIRLQLPGQRATPQVKAHVSVLLGLLALVQAAKYWLDQYELVFSTRGTVNGATYTDVNVQKKVIYLLVMISLFAFVLFIANIFRRGWVLPVLAVGLWAFVAILAGKAVPAFVQRVRVQPTESSKEAPYIEQNIEATRKAMNLDVDEKPFEADQELDAEGLQRNANTVKNIRLWDPEHIKTSFDRLQGQRAFYEIGDVDVDRYETDDELVQTMLATRNLDRDGVPQSSWEARHLTYTHGYGAVLAPSNAKTTNGDPVTQVRDIPLRSLGGAPKVEQPGIYIGEGLDSYVIVDTERDEVDYQDAEGETQYTKYTGKDGVQVGAGLNGFVRRSAFALRYGDFNPLISTSVKPRSKVLLQRDVAARVKTLAPFLQFDNDPYSVITEDGRIVYIVDGYTATNRYPNAQRADTADLPSGSGLRGRNFNYVRNSVKAVVDAYDGTVSMYVWDDEDPLIAAYAKAFPELLTDKSEIPDELDEHFRYPEDLFRVQTSMWGRYHVDNADDFYNRNDEWAVAQDPDAAESRVSSTTSNTTSNTLAESGKEGRIDPYYQLMKLPDEDDESFLIMRPFVPASSDDRTKLLTAFMIAKPDGTIETFEMPTARLPNGPSVVAAAMQQDKDFSEQQTLLTRAGSEVEFGNMLLVPIEQSLLYVRPVFVSAENTRIPQLKFVLVSFQPPEGGDEELSVAFGSTLKEALTKVFGTSPETLEEGSPPVEGTEDPGGEPAQPGDTEPTGPTETEDELIEQLSAIYAEAQTLRDDGDVVAYIEKLEEAGDVVTRLEGLRQERTGGSPADGGGTTTTTSTTSPP